MPPPADLRAIFEPHKPINIDKAFAESFRNSCFQVQKYKQQPADLPRANFISDIFQEL